MDMTDSQCKGCGQAFDAEGEKRKVGEWYFCENCFENLMSEAQNRVEKEEEEAPEEEEKAPQRPPVKVAEPRIPSLEPKADEEPEEEGEEGEEESQKVKINVSAGPSLSTPSHCHTCGTELETKKFKKLGNWPVCLDCYKRMIPGGGEDEGEEERELTEEEKKAIAKAAQATPLEERTEFRPGADQGADCAGCTKQMVKGASYEVGGEHFCPECYYTLLKLTEEEHKKAAKTRFEMRQEQLRQAIHHAEGVAPANQPQSQQLSGTVSDSSSPSTSPTPSLGGPAPGEKACEGCSRHVAREILQIIDGFYICQACRNTDFDSAMAIARKRHKLLLAKLRQNLDSR